MKSKDKSSEQRISHVNDVTARKRSSYLNIIFYLISYTISEEKTN